MSKMFTNLLKVSHPVSACNHSKCVAVGSQKKALTPFGESVLCLFIGEVVFGLQVAHWLVWSFLMRDLPAQGFFLLK
jgi:hypothetical protein